jgi:dsDNA-binding SOS-regulon protein
VGKNQVSIPVLNLPSKNHAKVTIEEEQVETVEVDFSLSREALIKELKNTRIELPEKYKAKKINESDGRNSAG